MSHLQAEVATPATQEVQQEEGSGPSSATKLKIAVSLCPRSIPPGQYRDTTLEVEPSATIGMIKALIQVQRRQFSNPLSPQPVLSSGAGGGPRGPPGPHVRRTAGPRPHWPSG